MNGPLEKITAFHAGPFVGLFVGTMEIGSNCAQFIRLDLHEAAVAAARAEGMREAAAVLDAKHKAFMAGKGRNPEDYGSSFSLAADTLRAEASK